MMTLPVAAASPPSHDVLWTRRRDARERSRSREADVLTWFALFTNPRCERGVELALIEAGLCAYLPEGRAWTKPRRSPEYVERVRVAFPRYVFVAFPEDRSRWGVVRGTNGVHSVVCQSGAPLRISGERIGDVRAAQDMGALDFNTPPAPKREKGWLQPGAVVTFASGPLEGLTATVRRPSGSKVVEIETWLFGRSSVSHVPVDVLSIVA